MEDVPVLDLADDRAVCVATMDAALRRFGFFYLRSHGVDPAPQFAAAQQLFALPAETKAHMPFDATLDVGYVGGGVQSLNPDGRVQVSGDTKEQFMMTNNQLITAPTISSLTTANKEGDITSRTSRSTVTTDPDSIFDGSFNYAPPVPGYGETTSAYASALFRLNQRLNSLLFEALALEDNDAIDELGREPFVVLKQMRYAADPSDVASGKFGAGAHTDWGAFTILATDATPGLQIQLDDAWLPVPPKPDCFIINSGDQIAQLTNRTYRSALHRVVTGATTLPRYSTAFFTYFGMHASVGPLAQFVSAQRPAAYVPQTSLEYFHYKLHESMGVGVVSNSTAVSAAS